MSRHKSPTIRNAKNIVQRKSLYIVAVLCITSTLCACPSTGSVILNKPVDTSVDTMEDDDSAMVDSATSTTDTAIIDTGNTQDTTPYIPIEYQHWIGSRDIVFDGQCQFTITEEGQRLQDSTDPAVQVTLATCPTCQVFRLQTSPAEVNCGSIGILPTGGERYRAVLFTDIDTNGHTDFLHGTMEVWFVIPPNSQVNNWTFQLAGTANSSQSSTWTYTEDHNFQAFLYTETAVITLQE